MVSSNNETGTETVFPHESPLADSGFHDLQRVKLIKFLEANPVLWNSNSGKVGKTAKKERSNKPFVRGI